MLFALVAVNSAIDLTFFVSHPPRVELDGCMALCCRLFADVIGIGSVMPKSWIHCLCHLQEMQQGYQRGLCEVENCGKMARYEVICPSCTSEHDGRFVVIEGMMARAVSFVCLVGW